MQEADRQRVCVSARVCGVWCRAELCSLTQARTRAFRCSRRFTRSSTLTHQTQRSLTDQMTKLGVRNTQTDPDRGKGKNYIQQEREKKKTCGRACGKRIQAGTEVCFRTATITAGDKTSTTSTRAPQPQPEPERALPCLLQLPDLRLHHWRSQLPRTTYRPGPMASGRSSGGAGTGAV